MEFEFSNHCIELKVEDFFYARQYENTFEVQWLLLRKHQVIKSGENMIIIIKSACLLFELHADRLSFGAGLSRQFLDVLTCVLTTSELVAIRVPQPNTVISTTGRANVMDQPPLPLFTAS